MRAGGRYFFPLSARCVDATASLSGNGEMLEITGADGMMLAATPLKKLATSSRLGAMRRRLFFPDGSSFDTAENDVIDAMLGKQAWLHRLESSWRMVLISVLFAGAAVAGFALYGVPAAAAWMALHTPDRIVRFATAQTLATLDKLAMNPTKLPGATQTKYRALFADVAAHAPKGRHPYRLQFRDAPVVGPNAFALPDGTIIVTDQMVAMVHADAEIEGVFGHEMSHVVHAHGLQSIYQASLVPAAIAFVTGDASQVGHIATILPGVLLQSAYSRGFEQQADDDAAVLMRRMGISPAPLADLLERIDAKMCGRGDCGPSWLGSHPATAARVAKLRRS